jgi:glycosyltransferase involved in cell wall biosynthesis
VNAPLTYRTGRRTRVLHIVPDLGIGGLPRVVETLCLATNPDRFDVRVLCLEYRGAIGEALEERRIPVDLVPNAHHPDRLAPLKVARYLFRNRFEVVHTHNTQAFLEGLPGAFAARVPTRIHTDHGRQYPDQRKLLIAERVMARFATHIVAVSATTAADLQRHQRISERRIRVISNGVDGAAFARPVDVAAKRRALGLPPHAPVLGLAARLVQEKGIIYLLQAMPRLLESTPALQLLIAGEGDLCDTLTEAVSQLGIANHVHFLGMRRDTPELLKAFDIFMLPSISEGLPMALLEAMAAGLPIIASDVGGVSFAVRHGVNGLLVPPADPRAISNAAEALLANPSRMRDFGSMSRDLFERHFSARAMAGAYETLYVGSLQDAVGP